MKFKEFSLLVNIRKVQEIDVRMSGRRSCGLALVTMSRHVGNEADRRLQVNAFDLTASELNLVIFSSSICCSIAFVMRSSSNAAHRCTFQSVASDRFCQVFWVDACWPSHRLCKAVVDGREAWRLRVEDSLQDRALWHSVDMADPSELRYDR